MARDYNNPSDYFNEAGPPSRSLGNFLRQTKLCRFYEEGKCKHGTKCSFAHSEDALRDAPDLTKTLLCKDFPLGYCTAGDSCCFAHSPEDLRKAEYAAQNDEKGRKLASLPPIEPDSSSGIESTPILSYSAKNNASSLWNNAKNWETKESGLEINAARDEDLRFLREFKSLTRQLSGEDSDARSKLSLNTPMTVSKLIRTSSSSSVSTQVASSSTSSLTGSSDLTRYREVSSELIVVYESC